MRPLIVCLLLLLPCMQAAGAAPSSPEAAPIVPVLTLTISPPIQNVTSTSNSSAIAQFEGTAMVDKLPFVRCVVTLTSTTDVGWVSQISPTTMVFTSTTPQPFSVAVSVPMATPTMQGKVTVDGRAVSSGLQSTAVITALIDVTGTAIFNATAANRTQANVTRAGGSAPAGPSGNLTMPILAVVLVAVPVATYVVFRRKRNQRRIAEA